MLSRLARQRYRVAEDIQAERVKRVRKVPVMLGRDHQDYHHGDLHGQAELFDELLRLGEVGDDRPLAVRCGQSDRLHYRNARSVFDSPVLVLGG